jgi:predicted HTH domain antitoxin
MSRQIIIDVPDDLLVALSMSAEQFESEARFALAAKLYEMGRLASGKAAQLAGTDRATFLLSLHRVGVAMVTLDAEEIDSELRYGRGE